MNEYDSSRMADALAAETEPARTPEEADIILFNTCSVRDRAQEKVFSDLGRMPPLKERNPNLLVGVGGCVASQEGGAIRKRAPFVDLVFGPQTIHRLPKMIAERRKTGEAQVDISFPAVEKFDELPPPGASGPSAFVSVMEGCSRYCSFCVVPYTRGEEISRPLEGVLEEVAFRAMRGAKEAVLLGQNVNAYRAPAADASGGEADFAALLECVAAVDGIERIRFTTSHPAAFSDRLVDAYRRVPQLPDYLHLPVQSGSDRILSAMKRGYTALEYKSIIRKVRRARPNIVISSDFIVGFPGEEEKDFAATLSLAEDIGFDFSYSFLYSPRPGTPAATMPDNATTAEKKDRLSRLQELLEQNGKAISRKMLGDTETVLVEGRAKRGGGDMRGRTGNNRTVNFPGDDSMIGEFVQVKIAAAEAHTLRGEVQL